MEEKTISITKDQLRKAVAKATYGIARYNPLLVGLGEVVAERLSFELFGPTKMPADGKQTGTLTFNEMVMEDKFVKHFPYDDEIEEKVVTFKKKEPKYKISRFEFEVLKRLRKQSYIWLCRYDNQNLKAIGSPLRKNSDTWKIKDLWLLGGQDTFLSYDDDFDFVKSSDEEATLIDDILNNCEVVDNE